MAAEDDEAQAFIQSMGHQQSQPAAPSVAAAPASGSAPDDEAKAFISSLGHFDPDRAYNAQQDVNKQQQKASQEQAETQKQQAAVAHATNQLHGPAPASAADMPWGDVASSAVKNIIPSTGRAIGDIGHAIMNPRETLSSIGQLATGAISKGEGAIGVQQDPQQKQKNESVLDALLDSYKNRYGSEAGIKNTIANDPASILMDASTIAGAGAATLPGKAAEVAAQAARWSDPIQVATRAASKVAGTPIRGIQSVLSGTPHIALATAASAGAAADPALRKAFVRHYFGTANTDEIPEAIRSASKKITNDTWSQYNQTKQGIFANAPGAVDFSKVDAAVNGAKADLAKFPPQYAPDVRDAISRVGTLVNGWKANPQLRTMENVDRLRDEVGNIMAESDRFSKPVGQIYGSIRQAMTDVDPAIADHLSSVEQIKPVLKDLTMTAGANPTLSNGSAIIKQLRLMRTGKGRDVLSRLAEADPSIPYMLAGKALHPFLPESGLLRSFETAAGGVGVVSAAMNPALWPALVKGGLAAMATGSPKIAGAAQYFPMRAIHSPLEKALYYGGQLQPDQSAPTTTAATIGTTLPRNARNNNWGNVKDGNFARSQPGYTGTDGTFARFDTPEHGAAATKALVAHYLESGRDTADKIVNDWAPSGDNNENDRAMYKARIAKAARVNGINDPIPRDPRIIDAIFHAIAQSEGQDYPRNTGGRVNRKSGGRANVNYAAKAAALIKQAEMAKKAIGKRTEPLLDLPDDHIAKALEVANESI